MLTPRCAQWRRVAAAVLGFVILAARTAAAVTSVEVNGVPIAVTEREVDLDAERAARELQARWQRETPTAWVLRERVGDRHIVARRRGALHETASFRPARHARRSSVVISVLDTRASLRALPRPPVELPPHSRWLSSVRTPDAASWTTVEWLALTNRPAAAARSAWATALRRGGWQEVARPRTGGELYRRGAESMALHWHGLGAQTSVVLQWRQRARP